jgi:glycosyltransferase involved in cell wall biosynthesis
VLFAGFLRGKEIDRAYKMADLYVMPSVSEPFGITPLESMRNGTPVLISKQSGVSEVITHCLKADFWNVDEMADKMISTLKLDALHQTLSENGSQEVRKFSWDDPAAKCMDVYKKALGESHG